MVLAQGDIGRSPRMQYHAYALAVNGAYVDLLGLAGVPVALPVSSHPRITCHLVDDRPHPGARPSRSLPRRACRLATGLVQRLWSLPAPNVVLVQLPPAMPWALLALLFARWRRARFIIDWHNLGWTMLALQARPRGLVRTLRRVESWIAGRADGHLVVSAALRDHLAALGCDAHILYDRPADWLRAIPADARTAFRRRLFAAHGMDPDRTVLIVSPTSWTADEDLDLVFAAADVLERSDVDDAHRPHVLFLVTGQGPARAAFEARASARPVGRRSTVRTGWVEPGEYATLLSSADAGLCLHRSSSGMDLPMKIADMYGVGVPVLALRYPAIVERLREGRDGLLFDSAGSLAVIVAGLWSANGEPTTRLEELRAGAAAAGLERWLDGWNREAAPLVLGRMQP
jgi:beta-1,4-mannosyltransferase